MGERRLPPEAVYALRAGIPCTDVFPIVDVDPNDVQSLLPTEDEGNLMDLEYEYVTAVRGAFLYMCPSCGSVVVDKKLHNDHHKQLAEVASLTTRLAQIG